MSFQVPTFLVSLSDSEESSDSELPAASVSLNNTAKSCDHSQGKGRKISISGMVKALDAALMNCQSNVFASPEKIKESKDNLFKIIQKCLTLYRSYKKEGIPENETLLEKIIEAYAEYFQESYQSHQVFSDTAVFSVQVTGPKTKERSLQRPLPAALERSVRETVISSMGVIEGMAGGGVKVDVKYLFTEGYTLEV